MGGRESRPTWATQQLSWLIILFFAFALGIALGEQGFSRWVRGAWTDIQAWVGSISSDQTLLTLVVDMDFDAYSSILEQRQKALDAGVFIASDADFHPATIHLVDEDIPVRLRLRQGVTAHLGDDDKWNLDVRTRDNRSLLGMQRFYLLDPADNNWLHEWAFQRSLAREGVMSTRYQFVNLIFNGDNRGIYALQEGFGPELMTAQARTQGVIVEFDATRLWQMVARFNGDVSAAVNDPVTNLSADDFKLFEVDSFRDAAIDGNASLSAQKDKAIGLLRSLQNGTIDAAELFDVELYGRFLALVDLWGATDATTLTNLRYYYNPESDRLEPVGFAGNPLEDNSHASGRLSLAMTYGDPEIQVAYALAAERYSQAEYLEQLESELDRELRQQRRALQVGLPLSLPWDTLRQRQEQMRISLNPEQPIFAYLGSPVQAISATIRIDVANVLNLPVEILGFDIDGATFLEANRDWIRDPVENVIIPGEYGIVLHSFSGNESGALRFIRFYVPLSEIVNTDRELDFNREPEIGVATRIWGLDHTRLSLARPGYPDPLYYPNPGG